METSFGVCPPGEPSRMDTTCVPASRTSCEAFDAVELPAANSCTFVLKLLKLNCTASPSSPVASVSGPPGQSSPGGSANELAAKVPAAAPVYGASSTEQADSTPTLVATLSVEIWIELSPGLSVSPRTLVKPFTAFDSFSARSAAAVVAGDDTVSEAGAVAPEAGAVALGSADVSLLLAVTLLTSERRRRSSSAPSPFTFLLLPSSMLPTEARSLSAEPSASPSWLSESSFSRRCTPLGWRIASRRRRCRRALLATSPSIKLLTTPTPLARALSVSRSGSRVITSTVLACCLMPWASIEAAPCRDSEKLSSFSRTEICLLRSASLWARRRPVDGSVLAALNSEARLPTTWKAPALSPVSAFSST